MRGRKPVPSALRKLHGNPRKVALPKSEPKSDGDLAAPPEWLPEDCKAGWHYALQNSPPGLLKRVDRGALVAWVVAESLHREATIAQSKVALLVRVRTRATMKQDDGGVPAASPYINIINQQAKIMLKAASELGFTPVSRPRIHSGPSLSPPGLVASEDQPGENHVSLEDYIASAPKLPIVH